MSRAFGRNTSAGTRFTLMTGQPGLRAIFGPLEALILELLWNDARPWTLGEVITALAEVPNPPARPTIQTTLHRLEEKGLLIRSKSGYRDRSTYRVTMTRDVYLHLLGQAVITALVDLIGPDSVEALCVPTKMTERTI